MKSILRFLRFFNFKHIAIVLVVLKIMRVFKICKILILKNDVYDTVKILMEMTFPGCRYQWVPEIIDLNLKRPLYLKIVPSELNYVFFKYIFSFI